MATTAAVVPMASVRGVFAEERAVDALEQRLAADPERPQFHLLPAKNWMNDPNGPIYLPGPNGSAGTYHMFFQYNPNAAVWGDMSWNHAVSKDMLHWQHMPIALKPTPGGVDAYGCFSGSAIAVNEGGRRRVYAVYTGTKESSYAMATLHDGKRNIEESQCLAWSDDPRLVRWEKDPQPVVARPPAGMKITGFRDPSAWKQGDVYYMTVGSGEENVGGCVLLYRSKDLKQWEYLHKLTQGSWNGKKTENPCDDGEMWECPEFFALDGQHCLIYSTMGKVFWQSGVLDEATMTFAAKKRGELDLGAFYAPKTQLDAQGRRILWGWIPEKRPDDAMKAAGWSGMMSLPRVMHLDKDGRLRVTVLPAVKALRAGEVASQESRAGATKTLRKASGEVLYAGARGKDFALTMSDGTNELVRIGYSAERHSFLADGREVELEPGDAPTIHGYVDGSVVEMILGERIGLTKRFYYTSATAPEVLVAVTGDAVQRLEAWKIAPISDNRLTTPA